MDRDAILKIEELVKDKKRIITVDSEPKDVFYIVEPDGSLKMMVSEPKPLSAVVFSVESLLDMLPGAGNDGQNNAYIYVSEKLVEGVDLVGDENRHLRHRMMLPKHPVYTLLAELRNTRQFSQRELVRLLKTKLAGFIPNEIPNIFSALKLSASGEGESVIAKGEEALGNSIKRKVEAKTGAIPDAIPVACQVFDINELRAKTYPVYLLVDVLPDEAGKPVFELTTVHNELADALHFTLEFLIDKIQSQTDHPVYFAEL